MSNPLLLTDKIGFSTLCIFQESGKRYRKYQDDLLGGTTETKDYFEFGTAFHKLVLQREEFDNVYGVLGKYPDGKYADAIKELAATEKAYSEGESDRTEEWLQNAITKAELKCSTDSLSKKLDEGQYKDMFDELINLQGKIILSQADWNCLNQMYQNVYNSKWSEMMGLGINLSDDNIETFTELNIIWYHFNPMFSFIPFNSTLDRVVVNHTKKAINIFDLKSTQAKIGKFKESAEEYYYPLQGYMYIQAVKFHFKALLDEGYTLFYHLITAEKSTSLKECCKFYMQPSTYNIAEVRFTNYVTNLLEAYNTDNWDSFNGTTEEQYF